MIRSKTTHWNWNHKVIVLSFSFIQSRTDRSCYRSLLQIHVLEIPQWLTAWEAARSTETWPPRCAWSSQKHPEKKKKPHRVCPGELWSSKKIQTFGTSKDRSFPIQCFNDVKPGDVVLCWWERIRGFWVSYQGATEVGWCFVPAGAAGPILTHIDVIHQAITIQEALPWETKHKNRVTKT